MTDHKQYPSEIDVTFIVADDIRSESTGQLVIVGMTPGRVIRPEGLAKHNEAVMPSLCFAFILTNIKGSFKLRADIRDPQGRQLIGEDDQVRDVNATGTVDTISMLFPFRPFTVMLGDYTFTISLDDRQYVRTLTVQESLVATPATS